MLCKYDGTGLNSPYIGATQNMHNAWKIETRLEAEVTALPSAPVLGVVS